MNTYILVDYYDMCDEGGLLAGPASKANIVHYIVQMVLQQGIKTMKESWCSCSSIMIHAGNNLAIAPNCMARFEVHGFA